MDDGFDLTPICQTRRSIVLALPPPLQQNFATLLVRMFTPVCLGCYFCTELLYWPMFSTAEHDRPKEASGRSRCTCLHAGNCSLKESHRKGVSMVECSWISLRTGRIQQRSREEQLLEGSWYLTGLITLLIIGITPIRPFRGIISRVISTVIIGCSKYHEPSSTCCQCAWSVHPIPHSSHAFCRAGSF